MDKNKLILLAGDNKEANEDWIKNKIEPVLRDLFDSTQIQFYEHWTTGEAHINHKKELNKLVEITKNQDNYVILGKSAGTLLVLDGVYNHLIQPEKSIFIGVPINLARDIINFPIDKLLDNYSIPSLFIQQSEDEQFPYADLKKLLTEKNIKNCEFGKVPGKNHLYKEDEVIQKIRYLTEQFLKN